MKVLHDETVTARLQPVQPPEVEVATALGTARLALPASLGGVPVAGATNPEQLFGSAYAGCMVFAVEHALRRAKLDPGLAAGLTATAEIRIGRAADRTNRMQAELRVELPALDQVTAERIVADAERWCPFHQAMHGNVETVTTVVAGAAPSATG